MIAFIAQTGLLELLAVCVVVGISLSTLGKIWPQAAITREQFTELDTDVEGVSELQVEMVEVEPETMQVQLEDIGEITVEVEVLDTETGVVVKDSGITVKMECD